METDLWQPRPSLMIFVADDDDDDIYLLKQAIANVKIGHSIYVSKNGQELIDNLSSICPRQPDIVFLDVNMPEMNGFECLRQIRSNYPADLPVFLLSRVYDEKSINTAMQLGATGFLSKTVYMPAFEKVLSDVLVWNHPNTAFKEHKGNQHEESK